jgi:hypothetical protein
LLLSAIEHTLGYNARNMEMYAAEPSVTGSGSFEPEIAMEKTKRYS